jgi:hypothetical protein
MTELIELTTNVSQIFTELYQNYNILTNPPVNVFENALYLEGNQAISIKNRMEDVLYTYHQQEGTIDLYINPQKSRSDQLFVAGNGSTQLYKGLVYALVTSHPDTQFLFVQKIPYFSGHRSAVDTVFNYPNATYQGYNSPSEVNPEPGVVLVEFVTSPNNPNGEKRIPAFNNTENNQYIIIGDFVFTSDSFGRNGDGYISENLEWLEQYRNNNVLILSYNSASKQFGHTGDRYGYMWFPMYETSGKITGPSIYKQLNNFLSITVGSNLYGSSNFLNLLKPLTKVGHKIRKYANKSLKRRSELLGKALQNKYPGSEICNVKGSPTMFVKINDPRIHLPEVTASDVIFQDTNVKTAPGSEYGGGPLADDTYVRINIMAFSEDLALFGNRLLGKDKYKPKDMLVSRKKKPEVLTVCDNYVANPGDRVIEVDGYNQNITIKLPQYLGFSPQQSLCIRRIDISCTNVKVKSKQFKVKLYPGECLYLVWSQPFYQNGRWEIINMNYKDKESVPTLYKPSTGPYVSHLFLV